MSGSLTPDNFLEAYDRFSDPLFRYVYLRVYDREQAKDIVQDTFVKTWDYLARGKTISTGQAFLYRTATNLIIDRSRKKKESSLDELMESGFDVGFDESQRVVSGIECARVVKMTAQLEEKYAQAVILRYVNELSPKEIAGITGESENAVSVRIHRGVAQLRTLLEGHH